jgi:hypothetical protein
VWAHRLAAAAAVVARVSVLPPAAAPDGFASTAHLSSTTSLALGIAAGAIGCQQRISTF